MATTLGILIGWAALLALVVFLLRLGGRRRLVADYPQELHRLTRAIARGDFPGIAASFGRNWREVAAVLVVVPWAVWKLL